MMNEAIAPSNMFMLTCEVCGSNVDVVRFDCAGLGVCVVAVCRRCLGNERFNDWLESHMEFALAAHPDLEPIGEGLWKKKRRGEVHKRVVGRLI